MSKSWDKLQQKLLVVGGTRVEKPPSVSVTRLLRQGRLFGHPVKLRRGERHECHRNAAEVWAQDVGRYTLCKGYGLTGGRWIAHSWVLEGKHLIETTYRMGAYYGVALSPLEACDSWYGNFLRRRHPGPAKLLPSLFAA